jgi:thiamine monophosphate kinase
MSEYEIIGEITSNISTSPRVVVPPGEDDCSVIDVEEYQSLVYNSEIAYSNEGNTSEVVAVIDEALSGLPESDNLGVLTFFGIPSSDNPENLAYDLQREISDYMEDIDHLGGDTNETEALIVAATAVGGIKEKNNDLESSVDFSEMGYALHSLDMINATLMGEEFIEDRGEALGYYVTDANLSDVVSSGGVPPVGIQPFGGINDPNMHSGIREGIRNRTGQYGIEYLEGNFIDADIDQMLGATAIGGVKDKESLTLRSGAEDGDVILATGSPGVFTAASLALETDVEVEEELLDSLVDYIVDTDVPVEELEYLKKRGNLNGGIDISDGLSLDLEQMLDQSDISGAEIYPETLGKDPRIVEVAEETQYSPSSFTWFLGGDWESLVTMPEEEWSKISNEASTYEVRPIGKINDQKEGIIVNDEEVSVMGYQAFESSDGDLENFTFGDWVENQLKKIDKEFGN